LPLSTWTDAANWAGAVFASYGSRLVDEEGNITVKSDETKQALEWFKRLVPYLPESVFAWDNAGNNKWLDSGKGALIMNPPSAWAVAVRDAPEVANGTLAFSRPKRTERALRREQFRLPRDLEFLAEQSAGKSLIAYLSTRSAQQKLVAASKGYDVPPYENLRDFDTWREEGPPKGVITITRRAAT
jgi:hypothetical protein